MAESPLLTLLQAWASQNQYQSDQVERWLQDGEAVQREQFSAEQWQRIEAEYQAVRAQVAINQCYQHRAMAFARQALVLEPLTMRTSRVAALSVLAESHFVQGELANAQQQH